MISTPDLITGIKRWAGHVARMEDRTVSCSDLVWKPEGNRPIARPRCRWEDNIKKWGGAGIDWIDLAHDVGRWRALVNAVMIHRVS